jgi:hypothetical protein
MTPMAYQHQRIAGHVERFTASGALRPLPRADEFMAELEDDTEEPTPELRALLRGAAG